MEPSGPNQSLAKISYLTCDRYADKVAVIDGDQKYSFATVRYDSNRVAETLLGITNGESVPVVILAESRYLGAIAILAVAKIGAYLSFIEPTQAEDYSARVVRKLEADIVLTTTEHLELARRIAPDTSRFILIDALIGNGFCADVFVDFDLTLPSNVVFTSGSTGEPKGIVTSHMRVLNGHLEVIANANITAVDVHSSTMSFSFGWGIPPIRYSMLSGCGISFFRYDQHTPLETASWIERDGLTVLQMPSAYFHQFVTALKDHPEVILPNVRLVNSGGEKVRADTLRAWQSINGLNCLIRDSFSSSEAGTYFTREFTKSSPIPDEVIFNNRRKYADVFIRTQNGEMKTRNAEGEIVVHTPYLLDCYFKNPTLTAEKLIPHPTDPTKKVFLTGDIGALDEQGNLHLGGRSDHMVKIRGYRMDLEEIRAEIKKLEAIKEAAVVKTQNKRGEALLAAYIQFEPGKKMNNTDLKIALLELLNPYKVPHSFTIVDSFRYGTAGKIQISELPPISHARPELRASFAPASTETEKQLARIWEDTLDLTGIGIDDDFFELGGDSISVLEMLTLVEQKFLIPASDVFFQHPAIRELAGFIDSGAEIGIKNIKGNQNNIKSIRNEHFTKKNRWNVPARLIHGYIKNLPFDQVLQFFLNLSQNAIVRNVLYWRHRNIFKKWLTAIHSEIDFEKAYQKHVLAELHHFMAEINRIQLRVAFTESSASTNPATAVSDLKEALLATPVRSNFALIPMLGFENLLSAIDAGKGVIFVSLHGNVRFNITYVVQHLSGIRSIVVVTHNAGKFGKYGQNPDDAEIHEFSSSNAVITADAQKQLVEGNALLFYSDTIELRTKNYMAKLLGSERPFKGGFAEMALQTGATIIPMVSIITDDGRIAKKFYPPLVTEKDNYEDKILDLVQQYAHFMESVWREHPETQTLSKMKKYLRSQRVRAPRKLVK